MSSSPDWIPGKRFTPKGLRRPVWRALRAIAPHLAKRYRDSLVRDRVRRLRTAPRSKGGPIAAIGLFDLNVGVARAANILCSALQTARQPVHMIDCSALVRGKPWLSPEHLRVPSAGTLAFCVNPPEMAKALRHFGPEICRGKRLVGYWWWELDRLPADWLPWADLMDEIWVSSRYIHANFSRALPGKTIRFIQLPIPEPIPSSATRQDFGLPSGRFTVLVAFDPASGWQRKNPAGAIEAFRRAFPDATQAQLVIKVSGADRDAGDMERLRALTLDMPNVRIIHHTLSPGDFAALVRCSDALLSLHRAEGLGLVIAEAMWLGTPIVATVWSGVLDMLDSENALLVRCSPVPVGPSDYGPVAPGATWADPDIGDAADCLRRLASDAGLRTRLSARARERAKLQFDMQQFVKTAPALTAAAEDGQGNRR